MEARHLRHFEILRNHLPICLEHMWSYLNIAYNMLALLYETVPALGET
jgi:hypothetical protein